MAQKPDGSAAKAERVTFTRPAAERIANAVRKVESGNRDSSGLFFSRVISGTQPGFRVATFTGGWSKNSFKTVTLKSGGSTVSAMNLFVGITASSVKNCAIAKDGTAWYLIAAECS